MAANHDDLDKRPSILSKQTSNLSEAKPLATSERPFSTQFFDKSPSASTARAIYLKTVFGGVMGLSIVIFAVCSIFWGSLWKTPAHTLPGWVVDFDGGFVGQSVAKALSSIDPGINGVVWEVVAANQFSGGISDLENAIAEEKTWVAVAVNVGASSNLTAAVATADPSYEGSRAITFIGAEARNENQFNLILRPIVTGQLEEVVHQFAIQFAKNISASSNIATLLSTAPGLVLRPIFYTTDNILPFDVPVASAVTFVGLIYLLILSMVSAGGRQASNLEQGLTLGSLIRVRLATSIIAYFFIALFYTLLSRAFQLPFDRRFGKAGFVIFWMLNWIGMLACGLALEAMVTILTVRFIPFFLFIWIISNVSVSVFPLQVLPHVYRYGYAFPFYNISRAVRTIIFGTKNDVGLNFGILIAWVAISAITLPLFQWIVHRKAAAAVQSQAAASQQEGI
ncbi:hypothetical protein B0H10DRAFT_2070093 [Mycena sp. CBHHK59/15]|nr:hypothetical protein B0H10DRAFT_2070093 [Mycena sp. CBHHK59/15]